MTVSGPGGLRSRAGAALAGSLLALVLASTLAGCGDRSKRDGGAAPAARVNREDIGALQVAAVLQQRGVRAEQADAVGRQVLERLIDQTLAAQRADELKLERDPRVAAQLETARREVLARAYVERVSEAAAKPTPDEVRQYFDEHPALFRERRVYTLQELAIEARPEQLPELRAQLAASKSIADFAEWLRAQGFRFVGNQAVRAAEQLPLASLKALAAMQDGQAVLNPTPRGAQVVVVAASRTMPVDLAQATPAIEQYLLHDRRRRLIQDDLAALRKSATIEYLGAFAAPPPAAAEAAASAISLDDKDREPGR